jgi:hypothetical protein
MSSRIPKSRQPRKDALYTRQEMQIIGKYKEEYRQLTTRELRANLFKTKILVDLYNYWLQIGKVPENESESTARMKVNPDNYLKRH